MIYTELIKDSRGNLPNVSVARHDWTDWVAWNADASTIPTEARFICDYPKSNRDWYEEPTTILEAQRRWTGEALRTGTGGSVIGAALFLAATPPTPAQRIHGG
ncbi:hypothetical protein GALMADRAFT_148969 [Galerina marginata CBS 339.88]|uniref:Uncharacterized protein n=1 Tax=Galerina marginata (strain CBS 339.88) TaxID=685588 RepID=A0A067SBI6_GALM3|nr:hypothetical protein GALMADRAFT_148969 [Galerina marginata CBS 339.88]